MPRISLVKFNGKLGLMGWGSAMLLLLVACANPNSEATAIGRAHLSTYLLQHSLEAKADLSRCVVCHRDDFKGTGPDTDCMVCHDDAPSFTVHVTPYRDAALHGPAAKEDLLQCLACHGTSPNRFDGGIVADRTLYNNPAGNCSASDCHPSAGAHPTRWQGDNDITGNYLVSHRTAGNQDTACAVCHDYTLGRIAPENKAPSCFSATFTNSDGVTSACHPGGGGSGAHDLPYADPQAHGAAAKENLSFCQGCHGLLGTIDFDGGTASTSCTTTQCHPAAGAHPTDWQGTNDSTNEYLSSHRTAGNQSTNCSICHDFTKGRNAPNNQAPSCYSASFTNANGSFTSCHSSGPGTPDHGLPYTSPQAHGAAAKADLATCQTCHGNPGTTAFNGGTAATSCATAFCHPNAGAHPTRWQGSDDNTASYISTHRNSGNRSTSCRICHDYTFGRTAPNPNAPSCFSDSFTNSDGVTTGCHD